MSAIFRNYRQCLKLQRNARDLQIKTRHPHLLQECGSKRSCRFAFEPVEIEVAGVSCYVSLPVHYVATGSCLCAYTFQPDPAGSY